MSNSSKNNGGGGGGRVSGVVAAAPFLMKTHQMVEERGTDDVISWGEMGASFVVWKPVEFARDLLPLHFKHNNFSSFVRQLNTYGFRKVVPDRWEFANDNFRRGEQSLLSEIRRKKATPYPSSANKSNAKNNNAPSSTSNSLEVHSSSTTSSPSPSSPTPLPPPSQQYLNLSSENEKLKKDNQLLNKELKEAKHQCQQLLSFLSNYVSTSNDINATLLIKEAALAGVGNEQVREEAGAKALKIQEEAENNLKEEKGASCLKLFGVLLKKFEGESNSGSRKRGRFDEAGGNGRPVKVPLGGGGGGAPWMGMSSPVRKSSKVCN